MARYSSSNLDEERDGFFDRDRSSGNPLGERLSFHHLHNEKLHPVGFFEPVKRGDAGMVDRSQQLRLALESRESFFIASKLVGQGLDGNIAPELLVARAVNLTHAAGADGFDDLVVRQSTARFKGHR